MFSDLWKPSSVVCVVVGNVCHFLGPRLPDRCAESKEHMRSHFQYTDLLSLLSSVFSLDLLPFPTAISTKNYTKNYTLMHMAVNPVSTPTVT
jgi:hypothetical protein